MAIREVAPPATPPQSSPAEDVPASPRTNTASFIRTGGKRNPHDAAGEQLVAEVSRPNPREGQPAESPRGTEPATLESHSEEPTAISQPANPIEIAQPAEPTAEIAATTESHAADAAIIADGTDADKKKREEEPVAVPPIIPFPTLHLPTSQPADQAMAQ